MGDHKYFFNLSGHSTYQGNGWLRVGNKFLPMDLDGEPVLTPVLTRTPTSPFLVDNGELRAKTLGLSYRKSKNKDDKVEREFVAWGSVVPGVVAEGGGWIQVGNLFLPMTVHGRT